MINAEGHQARSRRRPSGLRLAEGSHQRRSADASLLVVGVLTNPAKPEAGECHTSPDLRQEKDIILLQNRRFFDLLRALISEGRQMPPFSLSGF
jgi:hypothetical protein